MIQSNISRGTKLQRLCTWMCGLVLVVLLTTPVAAELSPDEIAIVAAQGSQESVALAKYYAKARSIPLANLMLLDFPAGAEISRQRWEDQVRPAIRQWLAGKDRLRKIRCFVTTFDVPLRIAADQDLRELRRLISYLKRERRIRVATINGFCQALTAVAGGPSSDTQVPEDAPIADVRERIDAVFKAAQSRVSETADETQKVADFELVRDIYFRAYGLNTVVHGLSRRLQDGTATTSAKMRSEFDVTRGRALGLREGLGVIEAMPVRLDREPPLLALIQLTDGVLGSIAWIDGQILSLQRNETFASFDSELSLVAWPDYQLIRWQPNYLHYRYDTSPIRDYRLTFMVSRLEAPTLELTRKIIDDAVAAEQTGLRGTVYLDGRGLAQEGQAVPASNLIEAYDRTIVEAAQMIRDHSELNVVLDTRQGLFEDGAAPAAAIYCGWYSLARYVDAFTWNQGAVAYHIGGAEASTLRDPDSQVWCKRLLEDGVAVTIGPVADSPITSFPQPNEFFALLLSGRFTAVEAYYRCKPFNSWTMTLVGDPLYAPFKNSPALNPHDLDAGLRAIIEGQDLPVLPVGENIAAP